MRNWNVKRIILLIVLPLIISLGLIFGLVFGIRAYNNSKYQGEKNNVTIVLRYTHPFAQKQQIPATGAYDDSKFIKYWDSTDRKEELVPYDADYKEIYKTTKDITLGDLMDDLNNSHKKVLFNFSAYGVMGRMVKSWLRPDGKYTLDNYPSGYILTSSSLPTNPTYNVSSNSLPNLFQSGIDSTYIQSNEIFYINFWHN